MIPKLFYVYFSFKVRERIIIPLDRQFVVYSGGASVDEGAGVDEGDVFYTGSLFYTSTLFYRDACIEEGSGRCR